jgi:hypothetical protein
MSKALTKITLGLLLVAIVFICSAAGAAVANDGCADPNAPIAVPAE